MKTSKNDMRIMNFKKFLSYLNISESLKEVELNKILDKISKKVKLSKREEDFLGKYNDIEDEELKDHTHLSRQNTFERIEKLLNNGKKIICNLYDRDGLIGLEIIKIYNDFENEVCILTFKNGEKFKLKDNYLYNIIYNLKKDIYSLEKEDEYFEKIPVKND
jgi:hypothetical protein